MSGDDGLALPSWAVGARGVVSVTSNVAPGRMVALWDAWTAGRVAEAAAIDRTLNGLYQALFLESSPAPCKAAAAMLGLCLDVVRLPLVPAAPGTRDALRDALSQAGVL
jgi:4-hydroxy-tetrahydrodipicolinate synthase